MRWLRALSVGVRVGVSHYWHHDEWELIGRYWHGPKGQRVKAISGGVDLGMEDVSAGGGFADFAQGVTGATGGGVENLAFDPKIAAAGTTEPGSSGFMGFLSKLGAGLGKEFSDSPLKALTQSLGLGATGFGAANQFSTANQLAKQTSTIQKGQKQAEAAAAPAVDFGTKTLESASAGNLTPAMQAQIDQWKQQAKADAASRLASMGLGNSNDVNQMNQLIDQQAEVMKGTLLQQQETTGLAALQTGVSAGTGVMGVAAGQQAQLASLIESANQALGRMAGRAA